MDDESAEIELLEQNLHKTRHISKRMISILDGFETHLNKLEKSMVPLHTATQILNRRNENIDKTIAKINEWASRQDDPAVEEALILRGDGADEYVQGRNLDSFKRIKTPWRVESMPPTISQCTHISCAPDDWWNGTNIRRWLCSPYELSNEPTPKTYPHPEPAPRAVILYTGLLKFFNACVLTATLVEVCHKRPCRIRMANGCVDCMKYFNLVFGIVWGCIIMWGWTR